jgi:hypothetical protein
MQIRPLVFDHALIHRATPEKSVDTHNTSYP